MKTLEEFIIATKSIAEELRDSGNQTIYKNINDVLKTRWTTTSEALEMILEVFDELSETNKDILSDNNKELLGKIYIDAKKLLNR